MARPFVETAPVMLSAVNVTPVEYGDAQDDLVAAAGGRKWSAARSVHVVDQHAARMAHAVRRHFALDVGESLKDFSVDELRTWLDGLRAQRDRLERERRAGLDGNKAQFEEDKPRAVAAARALVEVMESNLQTLEQTSDVFFELAESPLPALRKALGEARHALHSAENARWTSRGLELVFPPVGDSLQAAISEGTRVLDEKLAADEREDQRLRDMLQRAGIELPA
jgi:hypothetical protein